MKDFSELIKTKILEVYPDVTGSIKVLKNNRIVTVKGDLSTSKDNLENFIKDIIGELHKGLVSYDLTINEPFKVITTEGSSLTESSSTLDEVEVIYFGYVDIKDVKHNPEFKQLNQNNYDNIMNAYKVVGFLSPIVINSKYEIIDGDFRLHIAKEYGDEQILAVMIDDCGLRADFLRLALNRTAEFQRWNYEDVDNYVDSVPQAQPLLEPMGFFGNKLLPESFFSETILQYRIDPFNNQQSEYRQEEGLAAWAEQRTNEIEAAAEERKAQRSKRKTTGVSLFDLIPTKEDFVETYDIDKEVDDHVEHMKTVAGTITDNYDEVQKAKFAETGRAWQGTRRGSKQVAADNRQEMIDDIRELGLNTAHEADLLAKIESAETPEELKEIMVSLNEE